MPHFLLAVCVAAIAQPSSRPPTPIVSISLTSSRNGQDVAPGSPIDWAITVTAPPAGTGTLGLAGVCVDLLQDAGNARHFDIPSAPSVPAAMAGFSRPDGVSNPGPGGVGSGYGGTPLGDPNARNLVQIGGAQNTFGMAGVGIGLDTTVDMGVGQAPGGQVIASGTFYAPGAAGTYAFTLEDGLVTLLTEVRAAPEFSSVIQAEALIAGGITFTIDCPADWNNDGAVNSNDISAFLTAWLDSVNNGNAAADYNGDGAVNSNDISAHLTAWLDAVNNGC